MKGKAENVLEREEHEPKPESERLPSSGEFPPWKIALTVFKVGISQRFFSGDFTFVKWFRLNTIIKGPASTVTRLLFAKSM